MSGSHDASFQVEFVGGPACGRVVQASAKRPSYSYGEHEDSLVLYRYDYERTGRDGSLIAVYAGESLEASQWG